MGVDLNVFAITERASWKWNEENQDAYLLRTEGRVCKGFGSTSKDGLSSKNEAMLVAVFEGETSKVSMEFLSRTTWGESIETSVKKITSVLADINIAAGLINPAGIATFMNVGVGNSSIYLLRDGRTERLSKRTSYVAFRTGDKMFTTIEQIFRKVLNMYPSMSSDGFWQKMVEENRCYEISKCVEVIEGCSQNTDFSISDPDLIWTLSQIVRHLIGYVYGNVSYEIDEAIFRITETEVLKDKDTAFWAYFVDVFRDEHKSAIIENIIKAKHDEYTIDEYRSMSCFEVDEKNYWEFIQLLYDFRESPNLTKYEDEFEMAAMYIEAEEEGNQDVRYQTLIKKFWKGTVFYV